MLFEISFKVQKVKRHLFQEAKHNKIIKTYSEAQKYLAYFNQCTKKQE